MFKNTFQSGFLSILYSIGSKPLQIWDKKVRNGHIKRITDQDIQSSVLEIMGTNVSTNYVTCPADPHKTLGIKLPFLVMIIKNLKKYFTFEVQVLDDKNVRRRFRASNYQSTTRVKPFICTMPMRLDEGWNQIQFNLSDFTRRAYGTNYIETLRVQIHANCRIRRIYFSDRLYSEEELPPEFKLFLPIQKTAWLRFLGSSNVNASSEERYRKPKSGFQFWLPVNYCCESLAWRSFCIRNCPESVPTINAQQSTQKLFQCILRRSAMLCCYTRSKLWRWLTAPSKAYH